MDPKCLRAYGTRIVIVLILAATAAAAEPREAPSADGALAALVRAAWTARPAVTAAEAELDAAIARHAAADQPLYNPELEADAETAESDSFSVGLTQAIDWSGKRQARAARAGHEVGVARARLAAARYRVAAEVVDGLAAHAGATWRLALAEERVALLSRFAGVTERRLEAGDIGSTDATLAQLALSSAELARADARADVDAASQALRAASGLERSRWPSLPRDRLPAPAPAAPGNLIERLPALRALQAESLAAQAGIEVATRARRTDPSVGLRAGLETSDTSTDRLVGLSLSVPLNIRNRFLAEVDVARAEAVAADKRLYDALRQAEARRQGLARRYAALHAAWQRWRRKAPELLRERDAALRRLYETGELDATGYLVQLREGLDARERGAQLTGTAWQTWFAWLDASGSLLEWIGVAAADRPAP